MGCASSKQQQQQQHADDAGSSGDGDREKPPARPDGPLEDLKSVPGRLLHQPAKAGSITVGYDPSAPNQNPQAEIKPLNRKLANLVKAKYPDNSVTMSDPNVINSEL